MKKILLLSLIVATTLLITSCNKDNQVSDKQNDWTCTEDSQCNSKVDNCESLHEMGLGATPFCIDGNCKCRCGHRDSNGKYINEQCE